MGLFGPPDIDKLKAKGATPKLHKALAHKDQNTRRKAALALGELGGEGVYDALLERLQSEDDVEVRAAAAEGLGLLGDERAKDQLVKALDDDSEIAAGAVRGLGRFPGPDSARALIGTLRTWGVRDVAQEVLETMGSEAVPVLIEGLTGEGDTDKEICAELLGKIRDPAAVGPLVALLEANEVYFHEAVAKALIQIGHPDSDEILGRYDISGKIVFAIVRTEDSGAGEALILEVVEHFLKFLPQPSSNIHIEHYEGSNWDEEREDWSEAEYVRGWLEKLASAGVMPKYDLAAHEVYINAMARDYATDKGLLVVGIREQGYQHPNWKKI